MKIAVLSRHRRLLALCGISAALHLLVLQLIARHGVRELAPGPAAPEALVLRLAPAPSTQAAAPAAQRAVAPAPAPAPAPVPSLAAPRTRPAPLASAPAHKAAPAPKPPTPTASSLPEAAAPAPAATQDAGAGGAPGGDTLALRMPERYRVRMPATVHLVYTLTRRDAAGRQSPPQAAQLDWRNDDGRYTLHMDGVLGQVESSGVDSDSGIQPQRFSARRGGRQEQIGFDPDRQRIVFADGSEAPGASGMQDRASLLMQLAGIGLARPAQMQDVIEIVVAEAGAARVERFQVMQEEQLATGAGTVRAVHLAQLAPAGEARLEVWLAPDQGWLPVQLRLTQADGSSATQVLARAEANAGP